MTLVARNVGIAAEKHLIQGSASQNQPNSCHKCKSPKTSAAPKQSFALQSFSFSLFIKETLINNSKELYTFKRTFTEEPPGHWNLILWNLEPKISILLKMCAQTLKLMDERIEDPRKWNVFQIERFLTKWIEYLTFWRRMIPYPESTL